MPSGFGWTRYWIRTPNSLPSPSRRSKSGVSVRRRDQQDVPDAGQHQRRERVVDHRLVVDREQLLRDRRRSPAADEFPIRPRAGFPSSSLAVLCRDSDGLRAVPAARPTDRLAPVFVFQIPGDGLGECRLEIVARLPAELGSHLRGIDRITPIVAGTVLDEALQLVVAVDAPRPERGIVSRGGRSASSASQIASTTWRFERSLSAPNAYCSPGTPASSARTMPGRSDRRRRSSRGCCPRRRRSGGASPSSALRIISGISFSGYW